MDLNLLNQPLLPPFTGSGVDNSFPSRSIRRRTWQTRWLPEHIYEYYSQQAALLNASSVSSRNLEIPTEFTSILPLDSNTSSSTQISGSYGYISSVFKVISVEDGYAYSLRRVESVRSTYQVMDNVLQAWRQALHPSIITLRRVFSSTAAGSGGGLNSGSNAIASNSVYFLHDYFPGAKSLKDLYLDPSSMTSNSNLIPEKVLWSYVCQIALGLRAAHEARLSFRGLQASRVLVTSNNRVRLSGAGVLDVLEADSPVPLAECQQADILGLGHVLLAVASRNPVAHLNIPSALEFIASSYSPTFHSFVLSLISKPATIHDVCKAIHFQLLNEVSALYDHVDCQETLLSREFDNGRTLRLLLKLGLVNEKPTLENDPNWAETGDRYILKLYRDFLFHQVNDANKPVVDVAHMLESLNQLDLGTEQKILLSSRDKSSIIVTTYAHLQRALQTSFDELRTAAASTSVSNAATQVADPKQGKPAIYRAPGYARAPVISAQQLAHPSVASLLASGGASPSPMMDVANLFQAAAVAAGSPISSQIPGQEMGMASYYQQMQQQQQQLAPNMYDGSMLQPQQFHPQYMQMQMQQQQQQQQQYQVPDQPFQNMNAAAREYRPSYSASRK
jgi:Pan3 Pseudokinase domain